MIVDKIQILPLDPIDPSNSFYDWISYLSFPVALIFMPLIYPLKQYIRNTLGAIYSFMYALGVHCLLIMWPLHSIIADFVTYGSLTSQFFSHNLPIIYTIYAIMLCFLYVYIDQKLFSPNHQTIKSELITLGLSQMQIQSYQGEPTSFLVVNYKTFSKILSTIVFILYLGLEIYFMILLIQRLSSGDYSSLVSTALTMAYIPGFLLIGCWIINSSLSNSWSFVIIAISALIPSSLYPVLYSSGSQLNVLLLAVGPFSMMFWLILKSINKSQRILFLFSLSYLFAFFFIPAVILTLNFLSIFSSDTQTKNYIEYCAQAVVGAAVLAVLLYLLVKIIRFAIQFIEENQKIHIEDKTIDYNYQEDQFKYQPYKIKKTFSLQAITHLDLIVPGQLLNVIFFLAGETIALYCLNALLNIYPSSGYFYSQSIRYVVYSQFGINLFSFIILHYLISTRPFTTQVPNSLVVFLVVPFLCSAALIATSFFISDSSLQLILRMIAGFIVVMILLLTGFTILKNDNSHISNFLGPISGLLVWLLLIMPFLNLAPALSIYADQSQFGVFLYKVILISSALLIGVVFIITLIFNAILNRFEEEKKEKHITSELKTFFSDCGVESEDESLHRLYQSFQYRDKKYVYYLKHGYPVRYWENDAGNTELVTVEDYKEKKARKDSQKVIPSGQILYTKRVLDEPKSKYEYPCCMDFLNCMCGDEEMLEEKMEEIVSKKQLDKQDFSEMLPLLIQGVIAKKSLMEKQKIKKQKIVDNKKKEDLISTRTIELRGMVSYKRKGYPQLSDRLARDRSIRIECFHHIFRFFSNQDHDLDRNMIYNDLVLLFEKAKLQFDKNMISSLYDKYAKITWSEIMSLDINGFGLVLYDTCEYLIEESEYQTKVEGVIVEVMIPNLCAVKQFREYLDQFYSFHNFKPIDTRDTPLTKLQELKKKIQDENEHHKEVYNKMKENLQVAKIMDPDDFKETQTTAELEDKKISCRLKSKTNIYGCWSSSMNCLYNVFAYVPRKIKNLFLKTKDTNKIMQKRVKPWDYVSVECAKLLEKVESEYSRGAGNQHVFRKTFNNIFPAVLKILDLYYYLSLTLSNSSIPWFGQTPDLSPNNGGFLYSNYIIIFWISVAITFIYALMSIRAVGYIAEGRFGLTQFGAPASFPHPMFIFTIVYKIISLSLFSIIITTIYDTFDCNWTQSTNNVFYLYRDSSMECLSGTHTIYMIMGIIAMAVYYPISAYASPNFQFMQKSLDLKYKPSFLVLVFQGKFILVVANVLLTSTSSQDHTLQLVYISIIIGVLAVFTFGVWYSQPCMISWFNYIQLILLSIGLFFNIGGLVLYLTRESLYVWIGVGVACASVTFVILFYLKRSYFKSSQQQDQEVADNQELIAALQANHERLRKVANVGKALEKGDKLTPQYPMSQNTNNP